MQQQRILIFEKLFAGFGFLCRKTAFKPEGRERMEHSN